jgi:hypothetical protein
VQLKRFTSVKESSEDTRTADRIASVVTHVRGREDGACKADGPTAERAAPAEPPPTAAEQGQAVDGLAQIRQGLTAWQAIRSQTCMVDLALLVGVYRHVGEPAEGLRVLAEAQAAAQAGGERFWEAELHRFTGELRLARSAEDHTAAEAVSSKSSPWLAARRQSP